MAKEKKSQKTSTKAKAKHHHPNMNYKTKLKIIDFSKISLTWNFPFTSKNIALLTVVDFSHTRTRLE